MAKMPKKPKQPKARASVQTWKNYLERVKAWNSKVTAIKAAPKLKASIKSQADKLKNKA